MESSLSNKTEVILIKGGGRIWVTKDEANIAKEAKLAGDGVVDISGQIIEVKEIKMIINADTYQFTQEKRQEKQNQTFGKPIEKNNCKLCGGDGFILDHKPRVENGIEYGPTAIPCDQCNPNPPELSY